jgi:hypothetical protein
VPLRERIAQAHPRMMGTTESIPLRLKHVAPAVCANSRLAISTHEYLSIARSIVLIVLGPRKSRTEPNRCVASDGAPLVPSRGSRHLPAASFSAPTGAE